MRTDLISSAAWQQVESRWPGAYHLLLKSSLLNEYQLLKEEQQRPGLDPRRARWIADRLTDLERLDYIRNLTQV